MEELTAPAVDRLAAENAVIGSLLLDERLASHILAAVDPKDFANRANMQIFQAARALLREGCPVDPVTIRGKLGTEYEPWLLELMETTPTSANWREYAAIMRDQAALSRIKELAVALSESADLDGCREKIAALSELLATGQRVDAWTMMDAYRHFMEAQSEEAAKREYIGYGIKEIDEGTYTERGDVLIIGGEPSSGKTAFALILAYHMAKKYKVGFFSLETGQAKLTDRLVASAIGIDFNAIKRQKLQEPDWEKIAQAGADFTGRDMTMIRGSGMTVTQIQSISRSYGFDVVFIDYVQLIQPEGDARAPLAQQMAGVSRALHVFAQTSNTLVVELAQLSRPEKGKYREPDMHDLKESGQFEQDADSILLLYRPKPGGDYDPDKTRILKIAKQKEGRLGKWPMHFDGSRQSFAMLAGPDGKVLMQGYRDKAKLEKQMRRMEQAKGQVSFTELEPTGDEPF